MHMTVMLLVMLCCDTQSRFIPSDHVVAGLLAWCIPGWQLAAAALQGLCPKTVFASLSRGLLLSTELPLQLLTFWKARCLQDNPLARRIKEWQLGKLPFGFSSGGGGGGSSGGGERPSRGGPADSVQSLDMGCATASQVCAHHHSLPCAPAHTHTYIYIYIYIYIS